MSQFGGFADRVVDAIVKGMSTLHGAGARRCGGLRTLRQLV